MLLKMKQNLFLLLFGITLLVACDNSTHQMENGNQAPTNQNRKPRANEIVFEGKLIDVKSSSELIYTLTVENAADNQQMDFETNLQDIGKTEKQLKKLKDKKVKVYFENIPITKLADIHHKGSSILGGSAPLPKEDWLDVSGKLAGADALTAEGSKGNIAIISTNGKITVFEYPVTKTLADLNNQEVTVYYENIAANRMMYIKPIAN
jgi:hypothetical protein